MIVSDSSEITNANIIKAADILDKVFGYKEFRPLQKETILSILEGRDTLTVIPTGGGKSLCYQIPALMSRGLTLVISPLISLMQDQVSQLLNAGISADFLNSTLEPKEYLKVSERVRCGKTKLLYVAPESLCTKRFRNILEAGPEVSFITVDEAHCISEWGHDFRPDYLEIAAFRKQFPSAPCLALTATATKQVQHDIIKLLAMENPEVLTASFNRPNIYLDVKRKENAFFQITEFIEKHKNESGIIYCFSRKKVNELTEKLRAKGINALSYHAGLTDLQRAKNQRAFITDKADVMVATLAFGMGINKSNVRYVIHADLPKSLEQYYQETGRSGRDGLPSHALLLYTPADTRKIRWLLEESNASVNSEKLLRGMVNFCETKSCRRKVLLEYFGEPYMNGESTCCCDNCRIFPEAKVPDTDEEYVRIERELRLWRRHLADELNIPPYVIFGDKTLFSIAKEKPETENALRRCYGIGQAKLEKFGRSILRIVQNG
ncbi:MAG: ATP-dependent DNA helicase RecQ [Treponema sp.]|nr:ATP-dependent DNA helicase RecQ [Treponema sp.]